MRKFYPIFIFSLLTFFLQAQDLTIDGSVTVQPDGLLYVQGNVTIKPGGSLDVQSSGGTHGKVQVNYEGVGATGTWKCDGTTSSTGGDGEVHFLGDVDYNIKGTSVSFPNLIANIGTVVGITPNLAKITVIDSINITKTLDLKKGRMVVPSSFTFIASISGTTMTVTSIIGSNGAFIVGQIITGSGVSTGTTITAFGSGSGGTGTYTVSNSQTIASDTMSVTSVVYVSNSDPDAILSSGNGFGTNYSTYIQGSLRREVATGTNNFYKFPIGGVPNSSINKKGYNPAFLDLSTGIGAIKPANVTSILGKFEELDNPGTIAYNGAAQTCYFTTADQYLELFYMIQKFGYWDFKPNGDKTGWWYSFYCKPDTSYLFDNNYNLTHLKVVKAPDTFIPGAGQDWTPYVNESGNGCDGVNVLNNQLRWIPAPYSAYPYSLTDSIRASELKSFSRYGLAGGRGAALPIELLYLEAHPVDNAYIQVNWATATEINNSGFEVQRSTDGTNFTSIGWVPGAGNSSTTLTYGYPDHNVVANQLYYYRLKQVDFDGTSETTYVVSAMIVSSNTFTISEFIPNPTENDSRIEIMTSTDKDIHVTVFNTLGQIMTNSDRHLVAGTNTMHFDFNLLADGTYYAIFQAEDEIYSRKLILTK